MTSTKLSVKFIHHNGKVLWALCERTAKERYTVRMASSPNALAMLYAIHSITAPVGRINVEFSQDSELQGFTWKDLQQMINLGYPRLIFSRTGEGPTVVTKMLSSALEHPETLPMDFTEFAISNPPNPRDAFWAKADMKAAIDILGSQVSMVSVPLIIATDASVRGEVMSYAYVTSDGTFDVKSAKLDAKTSNLAERKAIFLALTEARRHIAKGREVIVLSDNQGAVEHANKHNIPALEAKLRSQVKVQWQRGHSGHPLNVAADRLARLGLVKGSSDGLPVAMQQEAHGIVNRKLKEWPAYVSEHGYVNCAAKKKRSASH